MSNFREVNDDILKDWLKFREDDLCSLNCNENRKHWICFDKVLKNVSEQNKRYVKEQLDLLNENFLDYIEYWNEKYYRNGFCDGVQLITRCFNL